MMDLKEYVDTTDVAGFLKDVIEALGHRASLGVVSNGEYVGNACIEEVIDDSCEHKTMLTLHVDEGSVFHIVITECGAG